MRILFLSAWYPFPPNNGYKIRVYHLLQALGKKNNITLLSFVRPGDGTAQAELPLSEVQTVPWKTFQPGNLPARLGFFSPTPRALRETFSAEMAQLVDAAEQRQPYDLIIASTLDTALYAMRSRTPRRLLEEHNLMTQMMREQYEAKPEPRTRLRFQLTYLKQRSFEARLIRRFDGVTMVSEKDASGVCALVGDAVPVKVIPNCVDVAKYKTEKFIPNPNTLVYNGSLTYSANYDAIEFFLDAIWQRILARSPQASLTITGDTRGVNLEKFKAHTTVNYTGYVPDIRPVVGQSWASVVPIRTGGGTRTKILEAMALGTPVIATRKGAEGLGVTNGENILLADDPEEFALQVARVLESPNLRSYLAKNAGTLVESKYDWQTVGAKFESFAGQIAKGRTE